LNLVPFEALSDGHDVIDRYSVSYMPAGRDLLDAPAAVSASPPVVIVSPGGSGGPHSDTVASGRADGFAMLAGAAAEAADARALLPGTRVFTGTGATEQHVKRLQAPALLLIVGHGVVRGTADCHASPCASPALDSTTQAMSLAAIVLEEAYGRGATSADDGLLTALELENMNLRGTEMLVLSQCRMASGLPSVGEGVYGMRRAAAIAGARTFVAPLWNVDDHVQRRLMRRFYERLAAGERRSDALRSAKLRLRQSPETNSFLYWAPVILSGSPDRLPDAVVRH
jgi:CHAT domain-containing protein